MQVLLKKEVCMKKNIFKVIVILLSFIFITSGCDNKFSEDVVDTSSDETFSQFDTYSSKNVSSSINSSIMKSVNNYKYQLPECCKKLKWYSDDIITKITFNDYTPEDYKADEFSNFLKPDCRQKLLNAFYKKFPKEIVDDMDKSIIPTYNSYECYKNDPKISTYKIVTIGSMCYDMNSDGIDDYIIRAWVSDNGDLEQFGSYLYGVYLANGNGKYKPIKWNSYINSYILSTSTNGVKDLMVLCNSNNPIIQYDGKNSYSKADEVDEKHIFTNKQILNNDKILKYVLNNPCVDYPEKSEYYVSIKFKDNPYLKENILYTCEPDGTPKSYDNEANSEYIFYAELKDGVKIPNDYTFMPSEIKCIPVE